MAAPSLSYQEKSNRRLPKQGFFTGSSRSLLRGGSGGGDSGIGRRQIIGREVTAHQRQHMLALTAAMGKAAKNLGYLFYVASPNETTFRHVHEVPNYMPKVVPFFITFILLEWVVTKMKGGNIRFNDALTSLLTGAMYDVLGKVIASFHLCGYEWLYERRLLDLDWSSPVTWWVAALGVDFGFYWFHRALHEINLGWANHQVHHSSEEYNLNTAIRKSLFQPYFALGFYQPLALIGVPFPAILVHLQINLISQFWIHTEIIDNCGPLEWVLNTPSHHRVHHGANKWCLDKNYAGVLIIWDRMFGTFQAERRDEKIAYGLVDQPQSFNVLWLQFFYFGAVFRKARSMITWGDSLRAIFYGPGWSPGAPRLGDPDTFPDVKAPRVKYDPRVPRWQEVYILLHFAITILVQQAWIPKMAGLSWAPALTFTAFIFVSAGIIGAMYDGWWWAPLVEAIRCIAYVAYARSNPVTGYQAMDAAVLLYFAASAFIWISQSLAIVKASVKPVKLD